jgi:hypothetical protein
MIRIAVVDDNKAMLNCIKQCIIDCSDIDINVDVYEKSIDFFHSIDNMTYDIVFLDIDMPEISGFELAETLSSVKPDIPIVFVSNLEHLAFRSFEFKPFGFVRKDLLKEDLRYIIDIYKRNADKKSEVYFFKTLENDLSITISDIIYFESMKHDIYVQTVNERYKLKRGRDKDLSIKTLSEQFEDIGFIRVHRSFLLNYRYIYKINKSNIMLKNETLININPHKVKEIRDIYQHFFIMEE